LIVPASPLSIPNDISIHPAAIILSISRSVIRSTRARAYHGVLFARRISMSQIVSARPRSIVNKSS